MEQDYQALVAAGPLVEALANGVTSATYCAARCTAFRRCSTACSAPGTTTPGRREELLIQHDQYRAEQDGLQNEQRGGTRS